MAFTSKSSLLPGTMTGLAFALAGLALADTAWEPVALGGDLEEVALGGMAMGGIAMGGMALGSVAVAPVADETMANSVLVSLSSELGPNTELLGLGAFRFRLLRTCCSGCAGAGGAVLSWD